MLSGCCVDQKKPVIVQYSLGISLINPVVAETVEWLTVLKYAGL